MISETGIVKNVLKKFLNIRLETISRTVVCVLCHWFASAMSPVYLTKKMFTGHAEKQLFFQILCNQKNKLSY